jgi:hypothetical protein
MSAATLIHDIALDRDGVDPTIEVRFGHAQVGNYSCYLWDTIAATQAIKLAHGNNLDNLPDVFSVPFPAASLTGKLLGFSLLIQSLSSQPGQLYSVTITVRQGAAIAGLVEDAYPFPPGSGAVALLRYLRFV